MTDCETFLFLAVYDTLNALLVVMGAHESLGQL